MSIETFRAIVDDAIALVLGPIERPTYNRSAALAYARKHWNQVTTDGYVATNFKDAHGTTVNYVEVPGGTPFVAEVADGQIQSDHVANVTFGQLDDCTHFMSCCVGTERHEHGGGLPVPRLFPTGPYGILSAAKMVAFLTKPYRGGAPLARSTAVSHDQFPDEPPLQPGDLVAYLDKGVYHHLAMYLGHGTIACHTAMRSDQPGCTWDANWKLDFDRAEFLALP